MRTLNQKAIFCSLFYLWLFLFLNNLEGSLYFHICHSFLVTSIQTGWGTIFYYNMNSNTFSGLTWWGQPDAGVIADITPHSASVVTSVPWGTGGYRCRSFQCSLLIAHCYTGQRGRQIWTTVCAQTYLSLTRTTVYLGEFVFFCS
jgi:hypothetical protein